MRRLSGNPDPEGVWEPGLTLKFWAVEPLIVWTGDQPAGAGQRSTPPCRGSCGLRLLALVEDLREHLVKPFQGIVRHRDARVIGSSLTPPD